MFLVQQEPVAPLVEHFFRHEAGRLVSVLTRLFGWRHFDLVEDMVQSTLLDALESWRVRGVPNNPSAWVHRIAKNKILDALRRDQIGKRVLNEWAVDRPTYEEGIDELFFDSEIEDSQLRMMFACCHPHLARVNQLALTLKALCGFGNKEIARALLIGEETVKKRLQRATRDLIDHHISLDPPGADELGRRLDSVHQVLYLLFNEGYSSSEGETAIRTDLCEEAARLCHLLCSHQFRTPATNALMALMLFHAARLESRLDGHGCFLLLEEQDRGKWDRQLIQCALEFLVQSAQGNVLSTFHLEAAIASHHCTAMNYAETDWPAILRLYDVLLQVHRSPVYLLNRAIVLAQIEGPQAGIRGLEEVGQHDALRHYHLYDATLGELYRRAGDFVRARRYFESARQKTHSAFDREIIDRRMSQCE
ncbi:MAG TPA: sigma-70 family RNA polymerase sigma factor [Gemmataceae bacterium]|jgi:RNA polymerase sigma-70 factor (ECF subfamily)